MPKNLTIGLAGALVIALLLLAIRSLEPSEPVPQPATRNKPVTPAPESPRATPAPEPVEGRAAGISIAASDRPGASSSTPHSESVVSIGSLQGVYRTDIERVNRVLRAAGQPEVSDNRSVSLGHLELLHDMVDACDKGINDCAERSLEFADPFREEMLKTIREDVAAGKDPPFQILRNGVIPKRNPHEILVTTAHNGVVYAGFVPQSNGLHEVLEGQRLAERARLESYMSWVAQLQ